MHRRPGRAGGAVAGAATRTTPVSPPRLIALLDALDAALAALIMLFGSTVASALGFGIGMTTTPFLLLFLEPETAVVVVNTVSQVIFALVIFQDRSHLDARRMVPVAIAGMLGVPVGVLILDAADVSVLRISITALIIALTVSLRFGLPGALTRSRMAGPAAGFVVGVLITALGVGGPLMAVLMLAREWPRRVIRVSLAFYFLLLQSVAIPGYAIAGLYTRENVELILVVAVPVLVGFGLATLLLRRMDERRFRQVVVTVIMLTSVFVLGREVLHLQGVIS